SRRECADTGDVAVSTGKRCVLKEAATVDKSRAVVGEDGVVTRADVEGIECVVGYRRDVRQVYGVERVGVGVAVGGTGGGDRQTVHRGCGGAGVGVGEGEVVEIGAVAAEGTIGESVDVSRGG